MSSFLQSTKALCRERGELWEDPDFRPNQTSVFYYQRPPFEFTWKRATEIYGNPLFIAPDTEIFDVTEGKLGDKWLVATLGVLHQYKGLFKRVVPENQDFDSDYAGIFRLHGSYEALKYVNYLEGLSELTAGLTEKMAMTTVLNESYLREWLSIAPRERERLISVARSTSSFWILYSDFKQLFPQLESLQLDEDSRMLEPSLAGRNKWEVIKYTGSWKRGLSAGGCRNHTVQLIVTEQTTVLFSLSQHKVIEPKMIGFSIIKLQSALRERPAPAVFRRLKTVMNTDYTNSRQPREEAEFNLRIFACENQNLKLKALDYPPRQTRSIMLRAPQGSASRHNFGQYEEMFLHLADERKTINTFELQELLDDCLPNEFIKSCASLDTCRQLKKGTGRITLSDFKDLLASMHHWQQLFTKHTAEKMGILRAERFQEALWDAGFTIPEKVMSLVVLRYIRKDGTLRFGDYVSAMLHVNRAFGWCTTFL
ncbi:Calpain-C, partial [Operophtera brumata]